ncbi:MAG: hypothetical protein AAF614_05995 [Chloroflexota bacterium]
MSNLYFRIVTQEDADREAIARFVADQLASLSSVENAAAMPEEAQLTGAEIIAGIAVTVAVVKGTRELLEELNKLIPEIEKFISNLKGIRDVVFEVGWDNVSIEEMDEAQIKILAEEMVEYS